MNTVIEERAAELQQATEALAGIREMIQEKQSELDTADTERQRLDSLIIQGDRQAMTDIIDARAVVNGLKTHLADLHKALAGAEHRRDEAEASQLEARVSELDVEGALIDEQMRALWVGVQTKVDKFVHEALKKTEVHNKAIQELSGLKQQARALRGEEPERFDPFAISTPTKHSTSAGSVTSVSDTRLHEEHVAKSRDRYMAPIIARQEQQARANGGVTLFAGM